MVGTVANNVLTYGVGGLNIDGCRVQGEPIPINKLEEWSGFGQKIEPKYEQQMNVEGRFPANFIHDGSDEILELFPNTAGSWGVRTQRPNRSPFVSGNKNLVSTNQRSESGSAARFFYCAKASKKDRNEGLDGFAEWTWKDQGFRDNDSTHLSPRAGAGRTSSNANHHPTVKPTDLMRYLCRLITPSNGTVLDPFTGSGSTGKAAVLEGFNFIGVEQSAEYIAIAQARIESAIK
jgi:site-specific DNA-methyltransferase (adenine-specific)